jgi:hypothetical protein
VEAEPVDRISATEVAATAVLEEVVAALHTMFRDFLELETATVAVKH